MNNISEKNGQPSMEEILASIRRIIADEPKSASPVIDLRTPIHRVQALADSIEDHGEFELPAIFRPTPQPVAEKTSPLLGRLTDAIRGASGASEARTLRNGDVEINEPFLGPSGAESGFAWPEPQPAPAPAAQTALPSVAVAAAPISAAATAPPEDTSLSTLAKPEPRVIAAPEFPRASVSKLFDKAQVDRSVAEAPAPSQEAATSWWSPRPQPSASAGEGPDTQRTMVPFRDTRMVRMGAVPAYHPADEAVFPPPAEQVTQAAAAAIDFAAIVPGQLDGASRSDVPAAASHIVEDIAAMSAGEHEGWLAPELQAAPPAAIEPMPTPPALPVKVSSGQEPAPAMGSIEDATADLLRPMLRQWLADNMPRMVEKALHIEVAESVRLNGKR